MISENGFGSGGPSRPLSTFGVYLSSNQAVQSMTVRCQRRLGKMGQLLPAALTGNVEMRFVGADLMQLTIR